MKRKILLLSAVCCCMATAHAQIKAYAITGTQKGSASWTEVRLLDVNSGDELKTIYQKTQEVEKRNARTGKPIVINSDATITDKSLGTAQDNDNITVIQHDGNTRTIMIRRSAVPSVHFNREEPFATASAALAYDKKHDRLYYTPMGINELRYIDIKTKTTKVYYFEGEAFGALSHRGDIPNQITRMVMGADGKGYALSNNADHLIQFETGKRAAVKDLGALIDDPSNGNVSVHGRANYGGDMIADAHGNLWLITANRKVFKIDLEKMLASYTGNIKGLPAGFSTNGAIVEKDGEASVIVCSSTSTQGYFRFDLNTLASEKVSAGEAVFNASDLANGNLAFSKKKKNDEAPITVTQPVTETPVKPAVADQQRKPIDNSVNVKGAISVYPNPVTTGVTRIAFKDHPAGRYQVQVMDISGKLLSAQPVTINNKLQVEEIRLPQYIAKGNYLVKVVNQENTVVSVNSIIVQ